MSASPHGSLGAPVAPVAHSPSRPNKALAACLTPMEGEGGTCHQPPIPRRRPPNPLSAGPPVHQRGPHHRPRPRRPRGASHPLCRAGIRPHVLPMSPPSPHPALREGVLSGSRRGPRRLRPDMRPATRAEASQPRGSAAPVPPSLGILAQSFPVPSSGPCPPPCPPHCSPQQQPVTLGAVARSLPRLRRKGVARRAWPLPGPSRGCEAGACRAASRGDGEGPDDDAPSYPSW